MNVIAALALSSMLAAGLLLIMKQLGAERRTPELQGALALQGYEIARKHGCSICHTLDGSVGIGPTWLGLYGQPRTLVDGSSVMADEAYIIESIVNPGAKQVQGFENLMVRYFLEEEELQALVAFTRELGALE